MRRPITKINDEKYQRVCVARLFQEIDTNNESAQKVVAYLDAHPELFKEPGVRRIYRRAKFRVANARLDDLLKGGQ